MENKNGINVLDELSKGACMGMDAIHFIMSKVKDNKLKKEVNAQYEKYKSIHVKICKLYPEYNEKKSRETNAMNKAMTCME